MKCSRRISNFPEEISSLSYSVVFLYFFAFITEEGSLISPCYSLEVKSESESESCLTLCDPVGCSLPGSSVHGIFQAIVLEWRPFPSPGALPNPGIEPGSPAL